MDSRGYSLICRDGFQHGVGFGSQGTHTNEKHSEEIWPPTAIDHLVPELHGLHIQPI